MQKNKFFEKSIKYKQITVNLKTVIILVGICGYLYLLFFWHPATYVNISTNSHLFIVKIICCVLFAILWTLYLQSKFFQTTPIGTKQVDDYNFWNKFILHYAFMNNTNAVEKQQVLTSLQFLEESERKSQLIEIYNQADSIKEAHSKITEIYPYPHIRTFFSESESVLVNGDDNKLIQKSALYIDGYFNDINRFEQSKSIAYKTSLSFVSLAFILLLVAKLTFGQIINDFLNTFEGFIIFLLALSILCYLLVTLKQRLNRPLIVFGGEVNE